MNVRLSQITKCGCVQTCAQMWIALHPLPVLRMALVLKESAFLSRQLMEHCAKMAFWRQTSIHVLMEHAFQVMIFVPTTVGVPIHPHAMGPRNVSKPQENALYLNLLLMERIVMITMTEQSILALPENVWALIIVTLWIVQLYHSAIHCQTASRESVGKVSFLIMELHAMTAMLPQTTICALMVSARARITFE